MTEEFVEFGRSALADIKMLVSLMEESDRKLQHGLVTELPEEFFTYQSQLHDLVREYVRKLHTVWSTLINTEMEYTEEAEVGFLPFPFDNFINPQFLGSLMGVLL